MKCRKCEQLQKQVDAKQAVIDRLMLEYCPDEMSPEQLDEWKRNQVAVDPWPDKHSSGRTE